MFVQTQFCGLCSMRAPLHGCSLAGPAGGLANLGEFGGKWQGDFYHTTTPMKGGGLPRLRQDSSTISALNLPCLYLSAVH